VVFEAHSRMEQLVPGTVRYPRDAAWNKGLQLAEDRVIPVLELAREKPGVERKRSLSCAR